MSLRQELRVTSSKRKRGEFLKRTIILLGIAAAFILIILFLFFTPQLRIKKINISGIEGSDKLKIEGEIKSILNKSYYYIIPKDHLFFYPKKEINILLSKKFRVEKFDIDEEFPSGLNIKISERETWAVWCPAENSRCLLIDHDGFAFESAPLSAGRAIFKIIDARNGNPLGTNILPTSDFEILRNFIEETSKKNIEKISSANIKISGKSYLVYFKSGWYTLIDTETDIPKAIQNLMLALNNSEIKKNRQNLEYIDLRFPDKVFYKFR